VPATKSKSLQLTKTIRGLYSGAQRPATGAETQDVDFQFRFSLYDPCRRPGVRRHIRGGDEAASPAAGQQGRHGSDRPIGAVCACPGRAPRSPGTPYHAAACGIAVPSRRRFLLRSSTLTPNNIPPTARRTGRPRPIKGAGTVPIWAEKVTLGDALSSTKVPPFVTTAGSGGHVGHCTLSHC
jgi:hypothetical protein